MRRQHRGSRAGLALVFGLSLALAPLAARADFDVYDADNLKVSLGFTGGAGDFRCPKRRFRARRLRHQLG